MAAFAALSIGASGDIAPCCEFDGKIGSLKDNTLREIWNDKPLRDLRSKLAKGTRVKACWKCWQAEDTGIKSLRQTLNYRYGDQVPVDEVLPNSPDPVFLDFRFSNLCDFRCRTCYHGASSRWFADAKAMNTTEGDTALLAAFSSNTEGLAQFKDIGQNVTDLYFAGGEPLLEQQHYDLVKFLISEGRTDVHLSYNTSLSTLDFKKNDLVSMWKKFPNIHIEVSIDAIQDAGALIRKGFDWKVFRDNLARLVSEVPHVTLQIGVTVSVLNLMRITELHAVLVQECGIDPEAFNFHAVQSPQHYDIAILPKDMQEIAMVQIGAYARQILAKNPQSQAAKRLNQLLNRLDAAGAGLTEKTVDKARTKFRKTTRQLDKLRKEKTVEVLPELLGFAE